MLTTYTVVTPLLHNKLLYLPGQPVDLTDRQALPLRAAGTVVVKIETPVTVVAVPTPVALGTSTLEKMTVPEVTTYATQLGLTVPATATKQDILALIAASAIAAETAKAAV
jgi:hypothetical protein